MSRRKQRRTMPDKNRLRLTRLEDRVTPATLFALDPGGTALLRFNSATPGVLTLNQSISGLNSGENIRGIDFRPATGQLFGLGVNGTTARIGTLDIATGAFAPIGSSFTVAGTDFGFDFNPTNDRIRLTSDGENNFLINPNDGAVTIQGSLNPGNPNVVGSAYTNNFPNATTTTLFAIDSGTNQLFQQVPATGTLSLIGNLGVDTSGAVGFDIVQNSTAFAALNVSGQSRLFSINLSSGAATDLGQIAGATTIITGLAAQKFVWDGGGSTPNWTDGTNWVGNIAPSGNDDLVFPAGAAQIDTSNNNFAAGTAFNSITFTGAGYDIDGNDINLAAGILDTTAGGANDIGLDINLPGTQIWSVADFNHTLVISGSISGAAGASLNKERANVTTDLLGTLVFAGAASNTYTGTTTVNGGTLILNKSAGATAIAGPLVVGDGVGGFSIDDLVVDQPDQIADTSNVSVNSSGDFRANQFETINALSMNGGSVVTGPTAVLTIAGPMNLRSNATFSSALIFGAIELLNGQIHVDDGPDAIDGQIGAAVSGSAGLTKTGPGTLVLSGNNTYSGVTAVNESLVIIRNAGALGAAGGGNETAVANGATLQVEGALGAINESLTLNGNGVAGVGALFTADGGDNTWTGPITLNSDSSVGIGANGTQTLQNGIGDSAAAAGLTKVGAGTLILPAANTYRGTTTVNDGVLRIENAGALGDSASGAVVNSGAQLQVAGGATGVVINEFLVLNGSGAGAAGTGALRNVAGNNTWSGPITLGSDTFIGVDGDSLTIDAAIDDGTAGTGFNLTKELTGTLILARANTYRGTTTINQGILNIRDSRGLGDGTAGTTVNSGAQLQLQGNLTVAEEPLTLSGIGVNGAGALFTVSGSTIWNGPILLAGDTAIGVGANGTQTLQNGIGEATAAFGVTKVGAGTLEYGGATANTYTGATVVNDGTLQLNKTGGATAVAGDLQIGGGAGAGTAVTKIILDSQIDDSSDIAVNAGGTFDLNSRFEFVNTVTSVGGSIRIGTGFLDASGVTLDGNSIFSIDISGSVPAGLLTVRNAATLAGIVQVNAAQPVPTGTVVFIIDGNTGATITGQFANFPQGSLQNIGGTTFRINYFDGNGNDVSLTAIDTAQINGLVFTDVDGNGVNNPGDPGLDGVVVQLDINGDGTPDRTTTTANGGLYSFQELPAGTFRVRIVVPANSVQTTPNPADITLAVGQSVNGVDFGVFQLVTVSGVKFNDLNGDGQRQPGEPGLGGVQIRLLNLGTGGEVSTTTSSNGDYQFQGVGPGSFQVLEVVPAGAVQTTVNPVEFATVSGANVAGGDFGNFLLISVSGAKFNDRNGDGVRQPGDNGVPGVTIVLTNLSAGGTPLTTTTDASGNFTFTNVGPGTYQIREVLPSGSVQTTPNPANFAAISGSSVAGILFGNRLIRVERFAVGAGQGGFPIVNVYDANGQALFSFFAYGTTFAGGVQVATADINGDSIDDVITGAGPTGGPHVKAFDGRTGAEIRSFFAYGASFAGGVFVAGGDVNGDGIDDILTGAGPSGGPHVKAFDGVTGAEIRSFFAYGAAFTGGVRVAGGDINGDGADDIITGAGPGGGTHVKAFSGQTLDELQSFLAYPGFNGGVYVAAGDINGDGRDDIITGAGQGGASHVKVFSGQTNQLLRSFFAYGLSFLGGVRVGAVDVNGDGIDDIITGAGPTGGPHVKVFDGVTNGELQSFFAFDAAFTEGVFVG